MSTDTKEMLADGIRMDAQYSIEKAKAGQLSPFWQAYAKEELQSGHGHGIVADEELDALLGQLDAAILSTTQFSDEASARKEVEGRGDTMPLCYRNGDAYTMMEIVGCSQGFYTAVVYLDRCAAQKNLAAYTDGMRIALRAWAEEKSVDLAASERPLCNERNGETVRFATVDGAASWIMNQLDAPEELLC